MPHTFTRNLTPGYTTHGNLRKTTYVGEYNGQRFTRTSHRVYTHAVIPVYTERVVEWERKLQRFPRARVAFKDVPKRTEPCEPSYGDPMFCGSYELAQKACKPGWVIVSLTTA